jgi:Fucose permease
MLQNHKSITHLLFIINIFFAIELTMMSPLLTEISKTYALTFTQTGSIFTANFLGFTIFLFLGGILADLWGKKKVLTLALVGFTLTLALFPLAFHFYQAFIAIIFLGGFGGSIQGALNAMIAEINADKSTFYVNLTQVFFGIGAIIGPISAGILINSGFPWQLCYFILAGVFLLLTTIFCCIKFPALAQSNKISWNGFTKLISDSKFLIICLCMFFYTGSEIGGWGWMATFCKQNLKFTPLKSSMAVAVFWGAMSIGRLICGRLSLHFSSRKIIIVLASLSTVATVLAGVIQNEIVVFLVITIMGLAYSSQWPLIVAYGSKYHPENSGIVYALLIGCGGFGSTLIPLLMGFIADNTNSRIAMISPAIWFLAIALIFMNFKRPPKTQTQQA